MKKLDLEQQRKRAKELLRAHRQGDRAAAERFERTLPRAKRLPLDRVLAMPLVLADAQVVVAREAGFPTWPRLKRHIESFVDPSPAVPLHTAVRARDPVAVRAALAAHPDSWQTREATEDAIANDDREIVRALLAYGAWVDTAGRRWGRWGGGIHTAILLDRPGELIEVLIDGGASLRARDRDGRTPLAIAVRTANDGAAVLLRARGARDDDEVSAFDRALGACIRGEAAPSAPPPALASDHQHLCWALRTGRAPAIPALLALGLDPDVPDDDGEPALHLAIDARAPAALDALLAAGARVEARNYRGDTALARAARDPDATVRAALTARLIAAGAADEPSTDLAEAFEDAVDAIVTGDLERLRGLLDREPALVEARSLREHRATLLHYSGANGTERQRTPPNAPAIAELLLARGADPDALALTYGGGRAQTPLYLAMSSSHPEEAGVMQPLIEALVRGGAHYDDHDRSTLTFAMPSALPALVAAGVRVDLWLAAMLGRLDDVRRLAPLPPGSLAPGAKVGSEADLPDAEVLDRALLAAAGAGHTDVVAHLLAAGARIEARGDHAMTALHATGWRADLATARVLLAHGAPLAVKNAFGGTPLSFALWVVRNHRGAPRPFAAYVQLLIDAGAEPPPGATTGDPEVDEVLASRADRA